MSLTVLCFVPHENRTELDKFNYLVKEKLIDVNCFNRQIPILNLTESRVIWEVSLISDWQESSFLESKKGEALKQIGQYNSLDLPAYQFLIQFKPTWATGIVFLEEKINYLDRQELIAFYESKVSSYFKKEVKQKGEHVLRDLLWQELGGACEVYTPVGYVDLLTDKEIIELKDIKDWKHGLGQLLSYCHYYPNHSPRLHLFNCRKRDVSEIVKVCKSLNVFVTYSV